MFVSNKGESYTVSRAKNDVCGVAAPWELEKYVSNEPRATSQSRSTTDDTFRPKQAVGVSGWFSDTHNFTNAGFRNCT
jgi:hypothetical protein